MKGGCQLGRKVVTHDSNSDLPLVRLICITKYFSIVYSGEKATSSECGSRNAFFYCSKKVINIIYLKAILYFYCVFVWNSLLSFLPVFFVLVQNT